MSRISPGEFSSELLGRVYRIASERFSGGRPVTLASLEDSLSAEEAAHLSKVLSKPLKGVEAERALSDYISIIKLQSLKEEETDEQKLLSAQLQYREKMGYGGNRV